MLSTAFPEVKSFMRFEKFQFPDMGNGWFLGLAEHQILRHRREELGLRQQDVADLAGIQLRQYTRLESGERSLSGVSMRIGLSVCAVLRLDPYDIVPVKHEEEKRCR